MSQSEAAWYGLMLSGGIALSSVFGWGAMAGAVFGGVFIEGLRAIQAAHARDRAARPVAVPSGPRLIVLDEYDGTEFVRSTILRPSGRIDQEG